MTDLDLINLARGAPPGPWSTEPAWSVGAQRDGCLNVVSEGRAFATDLRAETAAYLAALCPDSVLSLLSRARAAEKRLERLERLEAGRRELWAEIKRLAAAKDESNYIAGLRDAYIAGLRDAWADWALASDDPAAHKESDE